MFLLVKGSKVLSSSTFSPNKEICDQQGYEILEIPDSEYNDNILSGIIEKKKGKKVKFKLPPSPYHYYDQEGKLHLTDHEE